jgi:hypothetical protein
MKKLTADELKVITEDIKKNWHNSKMVEYMAIEYAVKETYLKLTSDNSDYAEIATKISKVVHGLCKDVPHDIGMTILNELRDDFA